MHFIFFQFLKYVSISGLTTLPTRAFAGCRRLEEVDLGEGLEDTGLSPFFGCGMLKTVKIPETLKNTHLLAFSGCGVQTIIICANTLFDCFRVRMLLSEEDRMKAYD